MKQDIGNWQESDGDWSITMMRLARGHVTVERNMKTGASSILAKCDDGEEIVIDDPTPEQRKEIYAKLS